MRLYYGRKRISVLNILKKNLSDNECSIIESDSGLHLILKLNCKKSDAKLKAELLKKNININMLSEYYISPKEELSDMYVLNYSNINLERIEETVKILKELMNNGN